MGWFFSSLPVRAGAMVYRYVRSARQRNACTPLFPHHQSIVGKRFFTLLSFVGWFVRHHHRSCASHTPRGCHMEIIAAFRSPIYWNVRRGERQTTIFYYVHVPVRLHRRRPPRGLMMRVSRLPVPADAESHLYRAYCVVYPMLACPDLIDPSLLFA